jgi:hypothetical protein
MVVPLDLGPARALGLGGLVDMMPLLLGVVALRGNNCLAPR